jgi:hypothetical protein
MSHTLTSQSKLLFPLVAIIKNINGRAASKILVCPLGVRRYGCYETPFITSQNREISIYVVCKGVILFIDATAAEILWMRRQLNTLKMVDDISWPHNIQDYYQPIDQPPITNRVIIKVTTAMVA